ncbi:MAG: SLOG cluster 4 domain-containing protein [Candidatus Zipacnadales bacterium]
MDVNRKIAVGVMGSAGGEWPSEVLAKCRSLGQVIAERDCVLITGACPGLPQAAVIGARERGGLVVGISPAMCMHEHVTYYQSPWKEYDILIFTGSGLMGREVAAVRSCDIVIIVGGRSGTLGEFAIAYDEAKLIGALEGTHGIADDLREIHRMIRKETGAEIIYDTDPARLVDRCIARHHERIKQGLYCKGPLRDQERPEPEE